MSIKILTAAPLIEALGTDRLKIDALRGLLKGCGLKPAFSAYFKEPSMTFVRFSFKKADFNQVKEMLHLEWGMPASESKQIKWKLTKPFPADAKFYVDTSIRSSIEVML